MKKLLLIALALFFAATSGQVVFAKAKHHTESAGKGQPTAKSSAATTGTQAKAPEKAPEAKGKKKGSHKKKK